MVDAGGDELDRLEARTRAARLARGAGGRPFGIAAPCMPQPLHGPAEGVVVQHEPIGEMIAHDPAGMLSLVAEQIFELRIRNLQIMELFLASNNESVILQVCKMEIGVALGPLEQTAGHWKRWGVHGIDLGQPAGMDWEPMEFEPSTSIQSKL